MSSLSLSLLLPHTQEKEVGEVDSISDNMIELAPPVHLRETPLAGGNSFNWQSAVFSPPDYHSGKTQTNTQAVLFGVYENQNYTRWIKADRMVCGGQIYVHIKHSPQEYSSSLTTPLKR